MLHCAATQRQRQRTRSWIYVPTSSRVCSLLPARPAPAPAAARACCTSDAPTVRQVASSSSSGKWELPPSIPCVHHTNIAEHMQIPCLSLGFYSICIRFNPYESYASSLLRVCVVYICTCTFQITCKIKLCIPHPTPLTTMQPALLRNFSFFPNKKEIFL